MKPRRGRAATSALTCAHSLSLAAAPPQQLPSPAPLFSFYVPGTGSRRSLGYLIGSRGTGSPTLSPPLFPGAGWSSSPSVAGPYPEVGRALPLLGAASAAPFPAGLRRGGAGCGGEKKERGCAAGGAEAAAHGPAATRSWGLREVTALFAPVRPGGRAGWGGGEKERN